MEKSVVLYYLLLMPLTHKIHQRTVHLLRVGRAEEMLSSFHDDQVGRGRISEERDLLLGVIDGVNDVLASLEQEVSLNIHHYVSARFSYHHRRRGGGKGTDM